MRMELIMSRIFGALAVGISVLFLTTSIALAQATGQIGGRVADASGAVLPGATVTLTRVDTGLVRTTVTNASGITLSGAAVEVASGPVGSMVTGVNIPVAGGGDFGLQHPLDGSLHDNRFFESNLPMPFPDALAEFRVSTSVQEASTGSAPIKGMPSLGRSAAWYDGDTLVIETVDIAAGWLATMEQWAG
ncbi:MAG: carboxypeptidase regulatory-like domain-containing protein, partial [Gemmatimonadetes bacterium]|nr:carboxypeptidase regulatory-like domain-containing protein [Gemmatimonadota bacterium]